MISDQDEKLPVEAAPPLFRRPAFIGILTGLALAIAGLTFWPNLFGIGGNDTVPIEWTPVENGVVYVGPGGFLNLAAGNQELRFSETGAAWSVVELGGEDPFIFEILGGEGLWLIVGRLGLPSSSPWAAWISYDGRQWIQIDIPNGVRWSGGVHLASSESQLLILEGEGSDAWLSTDGLSWERTETSGLPTGTVLSVFGGPDGFAISFW
jgi:hypothetical protein